MDKNNKIDYAELFKINFETEYVKDMIRKLILCNQSKIEIEKGIIEVHISYIKSLQDEIVAMKKAIGE